MDTGLKYVGKSLPINDAESKVTGKIKYVGDMELPGMLHGKLLLSDVPHGIIKSIYTKDAENLPGVVAVFTHKNTPDIKYSGYGWYRGLNNIKNEKIFDERVRFVGDRVAAVVAEDEKTAEIALKLIKVEYEKLPVVVDCEDALNEGSVKLHEDLPQYLEKEINIGNVDEAVNAADVIVEDKICTQRIHHAAMETHACLADIDSSGKVTVWSPCQIAFGVKTVVAEVLQLPYNKVRIIKAPMGGTFGGKQEAVLEPICAYFAKITNRPVRIVMNRKESIIGTRTRTETVSYVKTAVSKDGKISGRDIKTIVNTGAYTTNGIALSMALGKKFYRLYKIGNQRYRVNVVHTNVPVAGAARGYGSPQTHTISELNLEHAARVLGIDPVEFRLKNLIDAYDKDPTNNESLGNAKIKECLIKGAEEFNWSEKRIRPKDTGRFKRGIGLACATHSNGYGYFGPYPDFTTMRLRMYEDGSIMLHSGLHELGCGTVTTIKQIIAEILDVDPSAIEAPEVDTDISPYDIGSQASRVTHVCGECAQKVSEKLKNLIIEQASLLLGCSKDQLVLENGCVRNIEKTENKTFAEIATYAQVKNQVELCASQYFQAQDNPGSYGVSFAEVTVDTYTGMVKIEDFVSVHDVGKAINAGFVAGQIHGGVQMGIGYALSEEIRVNKDGNIPNDRFSKYHVVNAPDMPNVRVFLIEEGGEHGPYGAKSIGEICTVPVAAAVVNAINDALGTNLTTMPVTPDRIIEAIGSK